MANPVPFYNMYAFVITAEQVVFKGLQCPYLSFYFIDLLYFFLSCNVSMV